MRKYISLISCLLFISIPGFSQLHTSTNSIDQFIDEMLEVLSHGQIEDKKKSNQLKINQLRQQLETHPKLSATVVIYTQLADYYRRNNHLDSSVSYAQKAYHIAGTPKYSISPLLKVDALHEIAKSYEYFGELTLALKHYHQALTILDQAGDHYSSEIIFKRMSKIRLALTILYQTQEGYLMVNKQVKLFKEFAKENNLSSLTLDEELWLYSCSNAYYQHLGNIDSSFYHLKQGFLVAKNKNDLNYIARHLSSLISLLIEAKEYNKAKQNLLQLLPNTVQTGNSWAIARVLRKLAYVSELMNDLNDALLYAEQGHTIAKKSKNQLSILLTGKELASYYNKVNQQAKAYDLLHESMQIESTLKNVQQLKKNQLAELELRESALAFEKRQKEWQIKVNKQKNIVIFLISGLTLFFILLAYLFYLDREQKRKLAELLKKKKEELEELDHIKSRFFANISHELRTPLTLINSPIQQLLKSNKNQLDSDTLQHLQLVARNSQQLQNLVDDILSLSKLESNKVQLNQNKVIIKPLLERIASNFKSLAQHHNIHYSFDLEGLSEAWLLVDSSKFEKVLNNLLSNAIKYTPSGRSVKLTVTQTTGWIKVVVNDTGQGISATELPHIFDRYFQSKHSNTLVQGGTGIGLALSKELATLMGGHITVESIEGEGSTFTLQIPLIDEPLSSKQEYQLEELTDELENEFNLTYLTPQKELLTEKKFKLLVVEDHLDMQQFIKGLLHQDYHVSLAVNGKEALKTLQTEKIDLIISDVMMPEMNGYTLLQKLKASDDYRNIPVIMLTALDNESSKLKALTIGVDDYLAKPFSAEELLARIYNLLMRIKVREKALKDEILDAMLSEPGVNTQVKTKLIIHQTDFDWLEKVAQAIKQEFTNPDFRLSELYDRFHMSERKFQRKVKKATGMSPKKYQQELALQEARTLLENKIGGNLTSVAYTVGIRNATRFSKLYEARFGKSPSAYFSLV